MKKTILLLTILVTLNFQNQAQTVNDINGNVYNTITIGTQKWMVENLKTNKFNDGTPVPISISSFNNTTPNYCWYLNDSVTYSNPYGALYNWYAVNNGNLCPAGWHVPTDEDWTTLGTFLGGNSVAGEKLKEIGTTHWNYYAYAVGTNTTGFTGLPGGQRDYGTGVSFLWKGDIGLYWTSTTQTTTSAKNRGLNYNSNIISVSSGNKKLGYSVRCMSDIATRVQELKLNDIHIYPNPATDNLNVNNQSNENVKMNLKNILGQGVLSANLTNGINNIDISSLSEGIYVIEIICGNRRMQSKLIKK